MRKERGLELARELAVSGNISQNEAKESSPPALRTSFYFYVRTSSNRSCTCDQEFLDSPSPAQMEARMRHFWEFSTPSTGNTTRTTDPFGSRVGKIDQ